MFFPQVAQSRQGHAGVSSWWNVRSRHEPLLTMLILNGLVCWLLFILWHQDLLLLLFSSDRSRICFLISIIFVCMLLHCLLRGIRISCIANDTLDLEHALGQQHLLYLRDNGFYSADNRLLPLCPALQLLQERLESGHARTDEQGENSNTRDWLYERIGRGNQVGWFSADFMIKLGLLGTIVGFVFMLGSISGMTDVDVNAMRTVLQQMGTGMATALLTTMAGLGCSMVLGIMYFALDHYALAIIDSNQHLFDQARSSLQEAPAASATGAGSPHAGTGEAL